MGVFGLLTKWELAEFARSKILIFWNLVFPVLLFLVLASAFGGGGLGSVRLAIVDGDRSAASGLYARTVRDVLSQGDGVRATIVPADDAQIVVTLPTGFEAALAGGRPSGVDIRYDGSAGPSQRAAAQIVRSITTEFELRIRHGEGALRTNVRDTSGVDRGQAYLQFLATGITVLTLLSLCIVGIVIPLVARREYGMLRAFQALPLRRSTYLAAFVGSRLLLGLLLSVVFVGVVASVYRLPFHLGATSLVQALVLLVLMIVVFALIGLAIAGRLGSVAAASAAANLVFFPLVFLGDLTIPTAGFPEWLRGALTFSPSALGVSALRDVLIDGHSLAGSWSAVALLIAWGAAAAILARITFVWNKA